MNDRTQNPNIANFGIAKSLSQEIGAGAVVVPDDPTRQHSSSRGIRFAPFAAAGNSSSASSCAVQGQGPLADDGVGDINTEPRRWAQGLS